MSNEQAPERSQRSTTPTAELQNLRQGEDWTNYIAPVVARPNESNSRRARDYYRCFQESLRTHTTANGFPRRYNEPRRAETMPIPSSSSRPQGASRFFSFLPLTAEPATVRPEPRPSERQETFADAAARHQPTDGAKIV